MESKDIIDFWFDELEQKQWWVKDHPLDQLIASRFGKIHHQASQCELVGWRTTPQGRLAEIIILDQFSRNIYRDQPQAFACDPLSLALAQYAVSLNDQQQLTDSQRQFLYMLFMHSESKAIHVTAQKRFSEPQVASNKSFEQRHKAIIDRFGRYPHRNAILGRESSAQELVFLAEPGSSF
jgi:uncharacterized protein (DUF924 family)